MATKKTSTKANESAAVTEAAVQTSTAVKKPATTKAATAKTTSAAKPKASTTKPKATTAKASTAKATSVAKPKASTAKPKATTAKTTTAKAPAAVTDVTVKRVSSKKISEVKTPDIIAAAPVKPKTERLSGPVEMKKLNAAKEKTTAAKKRIMYVAGEVQPFAGTGGLGDVMGSLGKTVAAANPDYEVCVVMPLYESVSGAIREKMTYLKHINVQLSWRSQYCGIFVYEASGVKYYFIDNEYYYKRPNLYGYYDDGERFAFFSKAVLDILPEIDFRPDVLHCNDWQTALVPVYYKLYYMQREWFSDIKVVFTIHNIEYQGKYGRSIIEDVFGIPYHEYLSLEHDGCINLMKAALDYSDYITTVSPTYAQEILTEYYAHGLHDILRKNSGKLRGILNGIDTEVYNPTSDPALFANYSASDVKQGKAKNKTELQAMLNLPVDSEIPVVGIISRLVTHKGMDLIKFAFNELTSENMQIIILGKGDADFENYFSYMQSQCPSKVCAMIAYNRDLSGKIYAASDLFLMPSKSEPCGLSQMIASRYGTVPVVRETGGLADSIKDAGDGKDGNGYTFANYNAGEMLHAMRRALGLYRDYPEIFADLRNRVMNYDFSWNNSAKEYIKLYEEMISK